MIYILLDNLDNHFPRIDGAEVIVSPTSNTKAISWISGSFKALTLSKEGDVIVCWLDIQAVILYWLSRFLLRGRRKIIAINILLKNKSGIRNRIATMLYRKALQAPNVFCTVTSKEYGEYLNQTLGLNIKFTHLPDIFPDEFTSWRRCNGDGSVFCGGNNSRDWNFIIKVASLMPDTTFKLVMPRKWLKPLAHTLPKNVIAMHSLRHEDFIAELAKCSLTALPVDTEAPAGLIVIYQSTALGKMVITTDTATTRGYIGADTGVVLPNDVQLWEEAISHHLANPSLAEEKSQALLQFLSSECSAKSYAHTISSLIDAVK